MTPVSGLLKNTALPGKPARMAHAFARKALPTVYPGTFMHAKMVYGKRSTNARESVMMTKDV
jgi:hypothetical protein